MRLWKEGAVSSSLASRVFPCSIMLTQLGRHARVVSTVTDEEEFAWSRQGS